MRKGGARGWGQQQQLASLLARRIHTGAAGGLAARQSQSLQQVLQVLQVFLQGRISCILVSHDSNSEGPLVVTQSSPYCDFDGPTVPSLPLEVVIVMVRGCGETTN